MTSPNTPKESSASPSKPPPERSKAVWRVPRLPKEEILEGGWRARGEGEENEELLRPERGTCFIRRVICLHTLLYSLLIFPKPLLMPLLELFIQRTLPTSFPDPRLWSSTSARLFLPCNCSFPRTIEDFAQLLCRYEDGISTSVPCVWTRASVRCTVL